MSKPLGYLLLEISLITSIMLFVGGLSGTAQAQSKAGNAPSVELKCKILVSSGDHSRSLWLIELRNAAGAPLRQALRVAGDTVRFKNLLPGIYRIYLSGRGGRRRSESIDLTPAPQQRSLQVVKELQLPQSAEQMPGQYQVDVHTLAVPKEALQELQRSEKDYRDGNEDGAVQHLKQAVEIYPDYADAWNNLGSYYHKQGNFEKAIQSFTKVTELRREFYVGWVNLGSSLLATGKFKEAVETNKMALSWGPNDAVANSQLALSYYYLRDYTEAKKYFKRVLALDPAYACSPQLFLAHIAIAEQANDEARAYLRGFLENHPNAPNAPEVRATLQHLSEGTTITDHSIRK